MKYPVKHLFVDGFHFRVTIYGWKPEKRSAYYIGTPPATPLPQTFDYKVRIRHVNHPGLEFVQRIGYVENGPGLPAHPAVGYAAYSVLSSLLMLFEDTRHAIWLHFDEELHTSKPVTEEAIDRLANAVSFALAVGYDKVKAAIDKFPESDIDF